MDETIGKFNDNKIFFAIILASVIIGIFIFLSFSSNNPSASTENVIKEIESIEGTKLVTKIIDGDTVIIEGGDSIRLLGKSRRTCFK